MLYILCNTGMRIIMNISLPKETALEVKRESREQGFASVSEFFRHLVREEKRRQLARELASQRKRGGWKKLKSLRNLR